MGHRHHKPMAYAQKLIISEIIKEAKVRITKHRQILGDKMSDQKTQLLICCCCGMPTKGRQWWNRDTGYGLCDDCIEYCGADIPVGQTAESYGIRGYHYDITNRRPT